MPGSALKRSDEYVIIRDTNFRFTNFAGAEEKFNKLGDRNFSIWLPEDAAEDMARKGWNVKMTKIREEGDIEEPYLSVKVTWGKKPPKITLVTSRGMNPILHPRMLKIIDMSDVDSVSVTLSPYHYDVNGSRGISAYLKTAFVRLYEDPLELEFRAEAERKGIRYGWDNMGDEDDVVDAEFVEEDGPLALEGGSRAITQDPPF